MGKEGRLTGEVGRILMGPPFDSGLLVNSSGRKNCWVYSWDTSNFLDRGINQLTMFGGPTMY